MDTIEQSPAPAEQSPVADPQVETDQQQETPKDEASTPEPRRSRREALEKAFSDVGDGEGEDGPDKSVEPKDTKPKTEAKEGEGPARGPDGKFMPKEGAEKPAEGVEAAKAPDTTSKLSEAPARFSEDAKAAWKDAPEAVRAEAQRAIRETEQGIQRYKQQLEPIAPFLQMAKGDPKALATAMDRYVNTENMLRQDPVRGFTDIARNMGLSPQQVGQMLLGQQPGKSDPRDQEINTLRQELQELKQGYGQINQTMTQQREQSVLSQVDQFAQGNPRFDELSDEIANLLQTGYAKDLQDAYDKADRLNPAAAPAVQETSPAQPAQTRPARSVTGAPTSGSNPANRQPSTNRREALERSFARAGLS